MGNKSILQVIIDHSVGNIIRMIRTIRLPKEEHGPISWNFVGTLAAVLIFGLLMLFSASYSTGYYNNNGDLYHFIRPQAVIAVVGFIGMLVLSNINYRALRFLNESLYIITIVLLIWALFCADINGCHRWVYFLPHNGGSFQPSELAKLSMILWVADYTDKHHAQRKTLMHGIVMPALPLVPILVLLYKEPHHSAMILLLAIFGAMLVCGGCGLKWIPAVGVTGVAGVWYLLQNRASEGSYVGTRLGGAWGLNPGDTSDMLWQTKQSIYAIASGGLFGVGIGNSNQKHLWLPESTNDFIYSILCEELGFLGALLCILLFAALIVQGILIALRAPDFYGSMLGIGIMAQVAVQTFGHIGVATAFLPNTGISLPFFSSGGTSLLILLGEMGIMLSISRAGNARIEAMERRKREKADAYIYRRTMERSTSRT